MARIYLSDVLDKSILFLSVLGIIANIVVCLLVVASKQLRTYVNGFLISLAVSDILTFTTLFVYEDFRGKPHKTKLERAFLKYLICVTISSEIGNLCAVSFERYLAVVKPFHYKTRVKKYFAWIITSLWAVSIIGSLMVFLRFTSINKPAFKTMYITFAALFVFVPFLFMIILYVRIYVELRRQKRRVDNLRQSQQQPSNPRRSREAKIVKIFSLVAFLYSASWIPAIVYEFVKEVHDFRLPGNGNASLAIQLFISGSVVSSLANPFIYTFAKQDFRQQIRRMYRNIKKKVVSLPTDVRSFSAPSSSKGTLDTLNLKRFSHSSNRRISKNQ